MLPHYLWKIEVQICGKLSTRWTFSRAVMVSVGISKLGLWDFIFVHPAVKINGGDYQVITISSVGCSWNKAKLAWRILPWNMFVLPYHVVYNLSKNVSQWTTLTQPVRAFSATTPGPGRRGGVRPNPTNLPVDPPLGHHCGSATHNANKISVEVINSKL